MDEEAFHALPEELTLREIKFAITERGRSAAQIILITTLLDAEVFTKKELAELYNIRWRAEIDVTSLKSVMEMYALRCKTPEMVRKEVWTHALAYDLIRTVIAQAAEAYERRPHEIRFKGTLQTINCFRDYNVDGLDERLVCGVAQGNRLAGASRARRDRRLQSLRTSANPAPSNAGRCGPRRFSRRLRFH